MSNVIVNKLQACGYISSAGKVALCLRKKLMLDQKWLFNPPVHGLEIKKIVKYFALSSVA
jgi:hypothetical protein